MKLEDLCISFEKPLEVGKVDEFFNYIAGQAYVKIVKIEDTRQDFMGYSPEDVRISETRDDFRFEAWKAWTMIPLKFYKNDKSPETQYDGLKLDDWWWWKFNEYEADMGQFWPDFKKAVENYFSR